MKTKSLSIAVTLTMIMVLLIAACGSGSSGSGSQKSSKSPSDLMETYFDYLKNGKFKEIVMMVNGNENMSEKEMKNQIDIFKQAKEMADQYMGGLKSMQVLEENISSDGKTATVKVKTLFGNGQENEEENELIKVNGSWMFKQFN